MFPACGVLEIFVPVNVYWVAVPTSGFAFVVPSPLYISPLLNVAVKVREMVWPFSKVPVVPLIVKSTDLFVFIDAKIVGNKIVSKTCTKDFAFQTDAACAGAPPTTTL